MNKIFTLLIVLFFLLCCSSIKKSGTKNEIKTPPKTAKPVSSIPVQIIPKKEKTEVILPKREPIIEKKQYPEKFNHSIFNALLKENVTKNGSVNYKKFITKKKTFKQYLQLLSNNTPNKTWSKEDKLAYWMNAYNAFTIKLIVDNYPIKSIKDIKNPWSVRFFKLDKKWYNLNEIEHKILRKMKEPRIHFGINCASDSCPPLLNEAFIAATVNHKLDFLTRKFINNPKHNKLTNNNIQISKLFKWFAKDFKNEGSLINYLNKYSEITISNNATKTYLKYNWSLNN